MRALSPAASPCGPCCRHQGDAETSLPERRRVDPRTLPPGTRSRRLPPAPTTSSRGAHLGKRSRRNPLSRTLIGLRCAGRGMGGGGVDEDHGAGGGGGEGHGGACGGRVMWFQQRQSRGAAYHLQTREVTRGSKSPAKASAHRRHDDLDHLDDRSIQII